MRITQNSLVQQVIANVQNRIRAVLDSQNQLSSGKRVKYASQDPTAAAEMLDLNGIIRRNDQFKRNIQHGLSTLATTESTIEQIHESLITLRADAVRSANEIMNAGDRMTIAHEVDQKLRQIISLMNQNYQNSYLFGGAIVAGPPYSFSEDEDGWVDEVSSRFGDAARPMELIVDENQRMDVTMTGEEVLNLGDGEHLFNILLDFRRALTADDTDGITEAIDRLDTALDQSSGLISIIGTRIKTMNNFTDKIESDQALYKDRLSELSDTDIVEAVTRFQQEQNAYELSLRTAAQAIQPSLVNFINL